MAERVDPPGTPGFDHKAMPQPSHIYASTLHRRSRRWSRRRSMWPVAALSALVVLAVVVVLSGLG